MNIISLDPVPREKIVATFNDAFSHYPIQIEMTAAKLDNLIHSRSIRLNRSYGLWAGERLVALTLTGSRHIDGRLVAYNSAMGVQRCYQRQGLGRRLIVHTMDHLAADDYRQYRLEVITTNTAAYDLYVGLGFRQGRLLHSYRSCPTAAIGSAGKANLSPVDPHWNERMAPLRSHLPSWQNTEASVDAIAPHCRLVSVCAGAAPRAMAVLDPRYGILHQFGFRPGQTAAARQVLARALAAATTDLLVLINLDESDHVMHDFLLEIGFEKYFSQFEMTFDWP